MLKNDNVCFMRFPEGKSKALTLSYDDGVEQDIRLLEIMKKHGLKGTFNLNSGCYAAEGTVYPEGTLHRRMTREQCLKLYKGSGMEVAVHGLTHTRLIRLSADECREDVLQDRRNHEADFDTIVRGMAYPIGTFNDEVVEILRQCGILYARTVISTEQFTIPADWLRLPATCHHNNPRLMELAKVFMETSDDGEPLLFYLWGHSYEFEQHDNWNVMEAFAAYMGNRTNIWYATNIEVYDYVNAYRQLVFSLDGSKVYNPTCKVLYFKKGTEHYCIKPDEMIYLE